MQADLRKAMCDTMTAVTAASLFCSGLQQSSKREKHELEIDVFDVYSSSNRDIFVLV